MKKNNSRKSEHSFSVADFDLIMDSDIAGELSKYHIFKESSCKIRFQNGQNGYTLFFLIKEDDNNTKLVGLDGYGLRDKEFAIFINGLIANIRKSRG